MVRFLKQKIPQLTHKTKNSKGDNFFSVSRQDIFCKNWNACFSDFSQLSVHIFNDKQLSGIILIIFRKEKHDLYRFWPLNWPLRYSYWDYGMLNWRSLSYISNMQKWHNPSGDKIFKYYCKTTKWIYKTSGGIILDLCEIYRNFGCIFNLSYNCMREIYNFFC